MRCEEETVGKEDKYLNSNILDKRLYFKTGNKKTNADLNGIIRSIMCKMYN